MGSPANWNAGIKMASGQYIKMMHHDDWFAETDSLELFCTALDASPDSFFAFSISRDFVDGKAQPIRCDFKKELGKWKADKNYLVTYNFIGDPSTIIFRNTKEFLYDERMKWCVDTDFNLQLFKHNSNVVFIDKELIHIGTHPGQVTHTVQYNGAVVLYENMLLLNKHQISKVSIKQYDYYWRMIRNFNVRSDSELFSLAREQPPPDFIVNIVRLQSKVPHRILKSGLFSKLLMSLSYVFAG